jgi:ribosomal-protein-alanine N-acetyltransferase
MSRSNDRKGLFCKEKDSREASGSLERVIFREMRERDIDGVMEIERACFPSPWARDAFMQELQLAYGYHRVAELKVGGESVISGYIVAWLMVKEFSILNIAVRRDFRHQGIAGKMLSNALRFARRQGADTAWLEVRPSNKAARALYERFDFITVGKRKRYYQDSGEDALVMVRAL